ncbi:hypothetical protein [Streptomyces sp. NPDC005828]|uniref:hypothetical protein n=1 Tax=Streptomyces sp. NPDC005828 TaxID=3157071 RepID=UPI0033D9B5EB
MAVDSPSQSVAKAAGDTVARGRRRGTGKPPRAGERSRSNHGDAGAKVAPRVVV